MEESHPLRRQPSFLFASVGGMGLLPLAPGSWSAAAATISAWFLRPALGTIGLAALALLIFALGCWAADRAAKASGTVDPPWIVIDEVVGQWLVLALTPRTLLCFGAGFVLFRLADILKPWPIRSLERRCRGGFGIMVDDVAAAAYAWLVLHAYLRIAE